MRKTGPLELLELIAAHRLFRCLARGAATCLPTTQSCGPSVQFQMFTRFGIADDLLTTEVLFGLT